MSAGLGVRSRSFFAGSKVVALSCFALLDHSALKCPRCPRLSPATGDKETNANYLLLKYFFEMSPLSPLSPRFFGLHWGKTVHADGVRQENDCA